MRPWIRILLRRIEPHEHRVAIPCPQVVQDLKLTLALTQCRRSVTMLLLVHLQYHDSIR